MRLRRSYGWVVNVFLDRLASLAPSLLRKHRIHHADWTEMRVKVLGRVDVQGQSLQMLHLRLFIQSLLFGLTFEAMVGERF